MLSGVMMSGFFLKNMMTLSSCSPGVGRLFRWILMSPSDLDSRFMVSTIALPSSRKLSTFSSSVSAVITGSSDLIPKYWLA